MAPLTDFYIKQNDTRSPISIICRDGSGAAIDLTGATVKFIMATAAGTAPNVDLAGTVASPATSGVVQYQWATGNTATAGTYSAEFQVTFADGTIETFPNTSYITVHIFPELGS